MTTCHGEELILCAAFGDAMFLPYRYTNCSTCPVRRNENYRRRVLENAQRNGEIDRIRQEALRQDYVL